MSDLDCEGVDLAQDIGVRCQTREETIRDINNEPTPLGMMSTGPISEDYSTSAGPISDYKTTASTTRLVMMTNTTENQIATEASLIILCSIEALKVLTGLLAAALVIVTMGWIVSCVYWQRRVRQR